MGAAVRVCARRRLVESAKRPFHDLGLVVDQGQIREVGHRADGETGQQG